MSSPHDAQEQEAEGAARAVVGGGSARPVTRRPAAAGAAGTAAAAAEISAQIDPARSGGDALPGDVRGRMERGFGTSFGGVRLHTGADADRLAGSASARAVTSGPDVFLRWGENRPASPEGQRLLAHELAHVVQQRGGERAIHRQTNPPPTGGGGGGTPAARVVYIDANVVIQINRGNQPVADALRQMRASGVDVRISPFQRDELVRNPDIPRTATAQRLMLEEMNVQTGTAPTLAQRIDVATEGQTASGGNIMQLRDQQLVASARADGRNVEIWSLDTPFTSNSGQVEGTYGVRVAPESRLPVVAARPDYRVGRALLGLDPVEISLTGEVTRGTPPSGGGGTTTGGGGPAGGGVRPVPPTPGSSGAGSTVGTGTRVVAGGLAILIVVNEVLGGINRVRNVQQQNIDMGEARLAFWQRFGGSPTRGVWDQTGQHPLPAGTTPETSVFGSPSFPYVVDIDVAGFRTSLASHIDSYQDFLYFLDAAKTLGTIEEDPLMPDFPNSAQRAASRRYYAWVNNPDRAGRHSYDITDTITSVRDAALNELGEGMRDQVRGLSAAQQGSVFRLKDRADTPIYRSAGGGQQILTAQQVFGPDPWVRTTGEQRDVGGWFSTDIRKLVVPANADAQRAALVSGYWVKQPIEDTLDEVKAGGRPVLDRQPATGPVNSFVAGPEPAGRDRFGQTRYYRHPDPDIRWTVALGELHEFWVKAGDLESIPVADVQAYAGSR